MPTLGLALYWLWRNSLTSHLLVALPEAQPGHVFLGWLPYAGAVVAALLVIACAHVLPSGLAGCAGGAWLAAGACGALASALTALLIWGVTQLGIVALAVCELATFGVCFVASVAWGAALSSREEDRPVLVVAASILFSGVFYAALDALLPKSAHLVIVTALPLVFATLLPAYLRLKPGGCEDGVPDARDFRTPLGAPVALLVALVGIEELLGAAYTDSFGSDSSAWFTMATQLGNVVAFVCILAIDVASKGRMRFQRLTFCLLPVLVCGDLSLLMLAGHADWLACLILGAGYWMLYCLVWAAALDIDGGRGRIALFALAEGSVCTVSGLAHVLVFALGLGETDLPVLACASVLVIVVAFALLFARRLDKAEGGTAEREDIADERIGFDTTLLAIASDHSLTPRETEVFLLLARGRSLPYIQQQLGIALGTAQVHARHIYAKLDVHERQELLDLIEALSSPPSGPGRDGDAKSRHPGQDSSHSR